MRSGVAPTSLSATGFFEHRVELGALVVSAATHDGRDLPRVGNVGARIGLEDDEIGGPTCHDGAELARRPEELRRTRRRRAERLERRQPRLDHPAELVVEAET